MTIYRAVQFMFAAFTLSNCSAGETLGEEPGTLQRRDGIVQSHALAEFPFHALPVRLRNPATNRCLEVPLGDSNGDFVFDDRQLQLHDCRGSKNQEWWLSPSGINHYLIRSGASAKCIDVAGGSSQENTPIQQYECTTAAQEWYPLKNSAYGYYQIKSRYTNLCMTAATDGTTVQNICDESPEIYQNWNQLWALEPRYRLPVALLAKHSLKCLELPGTATENGVSIQQYRCDGREMIRNQHWYFEESGVTASGPTFRIVANHSLRCIDVAGGSLMTGAQVIQSDCGGLSRQKWYFSGISEPIPTSPSDTVRSGFVQIKNQNSGLCLTISGASSQDGALLIQADCQAASNQAFKAVDFVERRLLVVQVAKDDGSERGIVSDAEVATMVTAANAVYGMHGVRFAFDPSFDRANVDSSTIGRLGTFLPDGSIDETPGNCAFASQAVSPTACSQLFAPSALPKFAVLIRKGGIAGMSSIRARNWIVEIPYSHRRICTNDPDPMISAHEIGHNLGLAHTMPVFATEAAATAALSSASNNVSVFNGDQLFDTPPEPFWDVTWDRQGIACASSTPAMNMTMNGVTMAVPLDNIMSYYSWSSGSGAKRITPEQGSVIRATASAWGWPARHFWSRRVSPIAGDTSVAVSSWGAGRLDLFWRGADGRVKHTWHSGDWSGIEETIGTSSIAVGTSPAAVSWGSNRIDVFWAATDGTLRHSYYPDPSWHFSAEEPIQAGTGMASSPTVASWASGRLDLFYQHTNGGLRHVWYAGGPFLGEDLGGSVASAPSAVSWGPNRIDVFYRGTGATGPLKQRFYPWNGQFSPEFELAQGLASGPAVATQGNGRLEVYWRGTTKRLQRIEYPVMDGLTPGWGWVEDLAGDLNTSPGVVSWGSGRVDVFIQSTDRGIDQMYWEDGYWKP